MRKINKSANHAKNLEAAQNRISAEYRKMRLLCEQDQSANAKERADDLSLFDRKIAESEKMSAWWSADQARIAAQKAEKESAQKAEIIKSDQKLIEAKK